MNKLLEEVPGFQKKLETISSSHSSEQTPRQHLKRLTASNPVLILRISNDSISADSLSRLFFPGLKGSLQRMQLEYVDVVFANRPDSNTPMEGEDNELAGF